MLRVFAWKRKSQYVCASCRSKLVLQSDQHYHSLSSSARFEDFRRNRELQQPLQPRQCSVRCISFSPILRSDEDQTTSSRPALASFGKIPSRPAGRFGVTPRHPPAALNEANPVAGLLPHERAARGSNSQAPAPVPTAPRTRSSPKGAPRDSLRSGHTDEKLQLNWSTTMLADVFTTNKTPRSPPTPLSWLSEPRQNATNKLSENKVRSVGDLNKHGSKEATGEGYAENPSVSDQGFWDQFASARNDSKLKGKAPQRGQPKQQGKARATDNRTGTENSSQNFWDELETRVASEAEGVQRGRFGGRLATKEIDYSVNGNGVASEDVSSGRADGSREERRRSRLAYDDEEDSSLQMASKRKQQRKRTKLDVYDRDKRAMERMARRERRKQEKGMNHQETEETEKPLSPIFLPEYISISNLGQALKQLPQQFLSDLEEMGFENLTMDTIMTGDTASLVAMEYGFDPTVDTGSQRDLRPSPVPDDVATLPSRPPVVTIMGHVDHGKTTLLDWLRKSSVAAQEHGGITQHIGAFVVRMSSGKSITFLDTPGHAAFLSMRQRGANVTDIVVLVVAADDSVMPQTVEALKHATSAKVPIIVAINKIDKEDARVDQVKADLSRHGVEIEDYGGDVQVVNVSGKTGQGMADLEENIVTLSEILDVRAETDGMAEGWVLESSVKPVGRAATVLVKRGTLRTGDLIVAGKTWARIRNLRNEAGLDISEAPPGTPVEILGWRDLPDAGAQVLQAPDENKARTAVEYRMEMAERHQSSQQLADQEQRKREKAAAEEAAEAAQEAGLDAPPDASSTEPGITFQNVIVKADVVGSVEAVCGSIQEVGNNEVRVRVLRSSAGQITESDVDHAATSNSAIVNFNNPIMPHIRQRADQAGVRILDHSVIYHVIDDIKDLVSSLLPDNVTHRVIGEADVLQVFAINISKRVYRNIAGCRVRNGTIKRPSKVKVLRKGKVIYEGNVDTLKHVKKDVTEMGKGTECGIGFQDFQDLQPDDQVQTYEEVKEKRHI